MDFVGLKIGHATDAVNHTGCTVFLCPDGVTASVDTRGPAPGSRETALLQIDKPISYVHAILLTGGSAFGLSAADGVMRFLAEADVGHPTPVRKIPLVAAAVVYDLFLGGGTQLPGAEMGYHACLAATDSEIEQGNVGAGTGVTVGKWGGFQGMMKGGFGMARVEVDGVQVAAAAVINAVGDVVDQDGSVLAGARGPDGGWRADSDPWRRFPDAPPAALTNTTLVVLATNARLDKVQAHRLAQRAHDGMAIAIRPVHTSHDGDTAFAVATNKVNASFDVVANVGVEMVAQAIRNGVRAAHSVELAPGLAGPGLASQTG